MSLLPMLKMDRDLRQNMSPVKSSLGVNPFQQYRSSVLISGVDTPDCDRTLQVCTALPSPLQQHLSRPAVEPQGEAEADFSMLKTRFKLLAVTEQETNTAELTKDLPSAPALRLKSLLKIKSAVSAGRTESLQPKLSNRLLSAPKSKLPTPVSSFRLPTARTVGSTAGGDNKGVQVRLQSVPCVTCLVQECPVLPSGQRSRKLPFDELKLHSQDKPAGKSRVAAARAAAMQRDRGAARVK